MPPKPFAFVLMPFSEDFNDTYQLGIKPACEAAGYYCERLDEQIFEERMLDRIYNQIAKADLIVADMSGRNENVFYETGYAHALGKKVILLTRKAEDIPFDLKHHYHIVYEGKIASLKKKLEARAIYYANNPGEQTIDPFGYLTLRVNGEKFDPKKGDEMMISLPKRTDHSGIRHYQIAVALEVSENYPGEKVASKIRLLTPTQFEKSGWTSSTGATQFHSSILIREKQQILHTPPTDVEVAPGDAGQVVFELFQDRRTTAQYAARYACTLRIMISGLKREILLHTKQG